VTRLGAPGAAIDAAVPGFGPGGGDAADAETASAADAAGQTDQTGQLFRAASFNIHHGVGVDGQLDLERIATVIDDTHPDVIGLQEVDRHLGKRSDFVDQATWLSDRLDLHVVFGPNIDADPRTPGAPRRQYGTATLSSHRISEWRNTPLPRPEGGEQRGLLEVVIELRGVSVRTFNTQLQNRSQAERLAQIATVRSIVAEAPEPVVLVGDLNAVPDSPEIAAITEDLADSWVSAGRGDGFTFDAETPHGRIDYVLTSSDVVARAAAVVASDASDHLPVVADLVLPHRVGP
jgi:endonuclease/exonuclease/phosphatase family metal-dependent hydrolase